MSSVILRQGDCLDLMRAMADGSVDAIVTDPPYHLTTGKKGGSGETSMHENGSPFARVSQMNVGGERGFMGQAWDGGDIAFRVELWAEALRVLKPGGHLLAFSGTRTQHRMVCAIEDAGFEIRDQIGWAFGSGMPKSRNIAKYDLDGEDAMRWAGWGTALKPAWEPICVARKPLVGTVAANVLVHGTGAINIDGCRVLADGETIERGALDATFTDSHEGYQRPGRSMMTHKPAERSGPANDLGRWPANLIHDGSPEVVSLFPAQAGAAAPVHKRGGDKDRNAYGAFAGNIDEAGSTFHGDHGSAARFFYCPKASKADRGEDNTHPTVKPTDLMAYLVRLVTPPGGVVLDPFMGSGSTGKACVLEGVDFIGFDLTPEYVAIAEARIAAARAVLAAAATRPAPVQGSLL